MTDEQFNEKDSYMKYLDYMFKEKTTEELGLYREWFEERTKRQLPELKSRILNSSDGYYAHKVFGKYWRDLVPIYIKKAQDDPSARSLVYACVNYSYHQ